MGVRGHAYSSGHGFDRNRARYLILYYFIECMFYSHSIVRNYLQFVPVCLSLSHLHPVSKNAANPWGQIWVTGFGAGQGAFVGHSGSRKLASGLSGVLIAWQERSSRQAPFLLRAFPRPASPVRFRPSLPGVFDPGDEFIGPSNRLVNILEYGQALCEGGVHPIPFAWQWPAARPAPACRRKASGRRPSQP